MFKNVFYGTLFSTVYINEGFPLLHIKNITQIHYIYALTIKKST